jgi:hypothetical protein
MQQCHHDRFTQQHAPLGQLDAGAVESLAVLQRLALVEVKSLRKTPFVSNLYTKTTTICQDRLGTNIGKVEKKDGVFRTWITPSGCSAAVREYLPAPSHISV